MKEETKIIMKTIIAAGCTLMSWLFIWMTYIIILYLLGNALVERGQDLGIYGGLYGVFGMIALIPLFKWSSDFFFHYARRRQYEEETR